MIHNKKFIHTNMYKSMYKDGIDQEQKLSQKQRK